MIRTAVWSASPGHRLSHASVTRQARLRGSLIGILTQTSGLVEHLDLLGNLRLAASFRTRRASREELERLLSREVRLGDRAHARPRRSPGAKRHEPTWRWRW